MTQWTIWLIRPYRHVLQIPRVFETTTMAVWSSYNTFTLRAREGNFLHWQKMPKDLMSSESLVSLTNIKFISSAKHGNGYEQIVSIILCNNECYFLIQLCVSGSTIMEARDNQDFGNSYYFVSQLFDEHWKQCPRAWLNFWDVALMTADYSTCT